MVIINLSGNEKTTPKDSTIASPNILPLTFGSDAVEGQSITRDVVAGLSNVRISDREGRLYASTSGLCERKAATTAFIPRRELEAPSAAVYYTLGDAIEDVILKALFERNVLLWSQYKLMDIGINMGGYVDGIVWDRQLAAPRVLEIKSCSKLPNKPKHDHKAQATIYAAVTGMPATVFYMSRYVADWSTGSPQLMTKQFDLNLTKKDMETAIYRAAYGHYAAEEKLIPSKPDHMKKSWCGFCRFKGQCWSEHKWDAGTHVTPEQHIQLSERAAEFAKKLMAPKAVAARKKGALMHMYRHGSNPAKSIIANYLNIEEENDNE